MDKVYLALLSIAAFLLLWDAFAPARRRRHEQVAVRLLPLALFFWILVPWLQFAKKVF